MRFKATVESLGGKEYIGYIKILSRSHFKFERTCLDADSFAIDVNDIGCVQGIEIFQPKKVFKKYKTGLVAVLEELEKETPAEVREELQVGIEKALEWMEEEIRNKKVKEFESLAYVYGS